MRLLALDTSSTACSVAARLDDRAANRHEVQPREQTRLLMPMIRDVLDTLRCQLSDLDAIVLGNGPGSFIGMRIAASVAQGLAHGAGLKIVPVSSLAAVAAEALSASAADRVAVAQDAHMQEVYLGLYRRGADNRAELHSAERLQTQTAIAELQEEGWVTAGFGWQLYPELLELNATGIQQESEILYPDARYLLRLADIGSAILPENVSPAYLRQTVAQKPSNHGREKEILQ